ncbi:MAG: AbrB/MazE/SpoVT family DNA-binding domain-containing protein [Desulfurococcaceae archaeon]|nr:AbrB/MazE/SpoVT family DNA-binding domain-containing protein [Desulfurococcaceae archaeon]
MKVRRKGVIILPKELRLRAGIEENSIVLAEITEKGVLLRALKPITVRVDPAVIERILSEEGRLEKEKLREIIDNTRS